MQNRYRILSLLKQGGMGRVYLAEDLRFRSQVAVKEARLTQENLRRAFRHEAALLHRLRHQVLPHVTDHFTEGEAQYLVMQLLPGKDLEELLVERMQGTGEAFAVEQVLRWADQLLDALEYLHGHQPPIVHRDIKPQNLKLTERNEIILLDFGLAKGAAPEMSQAGESLCGYTHLYAPLEQIRGTGTDPRSDLYALAATLYRLITGHPPADALARATAILEGRPDPLRPANELNEQIPEAVAGVLTRALAQLPDGRPATATELRQALRRARPTQSTGPPDTTAAIDRCGKEAADLNVESEIAATSTPKVSVAEPTNVGRIGRQPPAPRVEQPGPITAGTRFRPTVYLAVAVLLLTMAALASRRLNRRPVDGIVARRDGSVPTPADKVMRYFVQTESETGRAERFAGVDPVMRGRWLKFHFVPSRRGYLYIVGPAGRGRRATFLTGRPNPAWGVKSNLLPAGTGYSFPPRRDQWIEVVNAVSVRTYTFIFSPEPLAQPRFLDGAADRELTAAEESELADLKRRFGRQVFVQTQDDQSIVTIPTERGGSEPLLFEISLHQEADQEGSPK
ncbi:MAG TPA: protein kinase [Blastocatellia bacterium]|nr:protein kinase [Blastocatellia bacterium]